MANYLDIFRKKTRSTKCESKQISNLITEAIGYTKVLHRRRDTDIECNLIIKNKNEGLGTAVIYTFAADDLQVGDYFIWKGNYVFLVTEEDNNVALDVNIKKFIARECNVEFTYGTEEEWKSKTVHKENAVFIGKSSTRITSSIDGSTFAPMTNAYDESVLIFSHIDLKKFESIKIYDTQWKVLNWDVLTNKPIIYLTIKEVPETLDPKEEEHEDTKHYRSGLEYEFNTEDYYFRSDDVKPSVRLKDKISIVMPYNKKVINFDIKENNIIVTKTIEIED